MVTAEPTLAVDYGPALPETQHSPHPPFAAPRSPLPWASTGEAKSHDMPQGFVFSEAGQGPCVPPRESWQGRASGTPSLGARVLTSPCPTPRRIRKEPGSFTRGRAVPHDPLSCCGFKQELEQ